MPGASSAPEPWCSPGWRADASQHCRIPAAGPKPQKNLPSPGFRFTRLYTEVHIVRPSGLPLSCCQWMAHMALGISPGLHTPQRRHCDACRERGRALSTHPELTTSHTALHSVSSLETCDLVSQRQKRSSSSTPNSSPVRSSGLRPVPGNDILICRWSRGYSWAFHDAWARTAQALEGRAGLRTGAPNPRQRGKQTRGQCSGSYLNES